MQGSKSLNDAMCRHEIHSLQVRMSNRHMKTDSAFYNRKTTLMTRTSTATSMRTPKLVTFTTKPSMSLISATVRSAKLTIRTKTSMRLQDLEDQRDKQLRETRFPRAMCRSLRIRAPTCLLATRLRLAYLFVSGI